MRRFLKLSFLVTTLSLTGSIVSSATALAQGSRVEAVEKSEALAATAQELASFVRVSCGCPNTSASLDRIAEAATDVELEARFGTKQSATEKLKDVIRELRHMRTFLVNVPAASIRLRVKRDILVAVNEAGHAVMGNQWVVVRAAPGADEDGALDTELKGVDSNLDRNVTGDFD